MLVEVVGAVADVHESDINLLTLQTGVVLEGLGAKVVLGDSTMFTEPRTTTLEH